MGDDEEVRTEGGAGSAGRRQGAGAGRLGWVREHALGAYAAVAIAYMLIPIAVIVLFSFNDPSGNFNISWQGFTLDHWRDPFGDQALTDALRHEPEAGGAVDRDRDRDRHRARAGARPPSLPRPAGGEHPRARADGDARRW